MTQKIFYYCDVDGKECVPQEGLGTLAGFIVKMNTDLKPEQVGFEGHYCHECCESILGFITELKTAHAADSDTQ